MTGSRAEAAAFLLALLLVTVAAAPLSYSAGGVYIVTVRPPAAGVDSGWYQMHILATALGRYVAQPSILLGCWWVGSIDFPFFAKYIASEEKARQALLYSYKTVMSGFAARLTPAQLAALQSKFPTTIWGSAACMHAGISSSSCCRQRCEPLG
jgi:hypothetical protein